ncbi:MAG: hypothetical protein GF364_16755 [Candidatus Lokiarchaeota archaeon]|nr:hypothetical protein [Candidatus Lokiarchaeota archaeon]
MGFLHKIFGKKKLSASELDAARESFFDSRLDVEDRIRTLKREIKKSYLAGKEPSPAKLIALKRAKVIHEQLVGLEDTLEGMAIEAEVSSALDEINQEMPNLTELLLQFSESSNSILRTTDRLTKVQQDYLRKMKNMIAQDEIRLETQKEEMVSYKDEVLQDLQADIMEELIIEDPEFAEELKKIKEQEES